MKHTFRAFLPAILSIGLLSGIYLIPENYELIEPCISPALPVDNELKGWRGVRGQESDAERRGLSRDTKFSKASYMLQPRVPWERESHPVHVSIVYSGQDLANSIHRPERCLPSQGHINVVGNATSITLANGVEIKMTRLTSVRPNDHPVLKRLHFVHYYVFFNRNSMCHTHLERTLKDIAARCLLGKSQSWAYFQAGTYWAPELGISKEEAERRLRKLICELLPRQIEWEKLK